MSAGASRARRQGDERGAPRVLWLVYGVLGVLAVAYLVSLIVRSADDRTPLLDDWGVPIFELTAAGLCFARAATARRRRLVPLLLGCAILAWTLGDFILAAESVAGTPPTPSFADISYLIFYPLAYVALVITIAKGSGRLTVASWLDGAVAGLGAAAVCASFPLSALLNADGSGGMALATNLAYPVGDLLLLALVVGGTAIYAAKLPAQWLLLAAACAAQAIGDAFNLLHIYAQEPSQVGAVFDGIAWPASVLLISLSVWMPPVRRSLLGESRTQGFVLPGAAAIAGLAILIVATLHAVSHVALGLATATLVLAGIRLALSARNLRSLTEERRHEAVTDQLTGLANRRHLMSMLDTFYASDATARTSARQLGFLFIDLDHFKEINDAFGHSAGDELLAQLGPRLVGSLRNTDVLVRIGGDEFGVVLTETDPRHASLVAERLSAKLAEPFMVGGLSVQVSASIGIAFAPTNAGDTAELMRCADMAMYRAKVSADRCFEIYSEDVDAGGDRLRLGEELRTAVLDGQLELHYQPQLDLQSLSVTAVEALLRWRHPRSGYIPPLSFLPLAEDANLMQPLTAWVLDAALAQCAAWRTSGATVAVSVNVSASNLADRNFVESVKQALQRHCLPPSSLVVEITETTIVSDFEQCRRVVAELHDAGVDVSIDDFGAGFTSLAYLGSLAVRELKVDRSLIAGLAAAEPGRDLDLVRALIELGHVLGLRVVAEGIEEVQTLELLARAGCDLAQGYFVGRPVPADQLVIPRDDEREQDPGIAAALLAS